MVIKEYDDKVARFQSLLLNRVLETSKNVSDVLFHTFYLILPPSTKVYICTAGPNSLFGSHVN